THADGEQAAPDEKAEQQRPDERRDAGIDARRSQMHRGRIVLRAGPKKFAEPVSLPSTASADLPLPGTALRSGFVLLALRARRKQHTNVLAEMVKKSKRPAAANCALFLFQHCASQSCNVKGVQKEKSRHVGGTKKIRRAGFAFVHRFR